MKRTVYERDTDTLFANALRRPEFAALFLSMIFPRDTLRVVDIKRQTPHIGHTGTIDLDLRLSGGKRLLIENKIDAGYSVTRNGESQPERYSASIANLRADGIDAQSVLLAPRDYLSGSRSAQTFDNRITYESLRNGATRIERALLDAAIEQAETPYEPSPNEATARFFAEYAEYAAHDWPALVLKHNPNAKGVRPTGSHTIYFDVPKTLRAWAGIPQPRMSLQCRDSNAPSASVKIMLGGLGAAAAAIPVPARLQSVSGYLRRAGRSLGCVIDTPQLDTQRPLSTQRGVVERGLIAAADLQAWWNGAEDEIRAMIVGAKR